MAVTHDILRTWRGPRAVIRDHLALGVREDRALAYLFAACLLIFVAQWPRLSRMAAGFDLPAGADVPGMTQLLSYELFAWLMLWPLMFYGIAAASHLFARLLGGQGAFFGARLALFWALLASTPLALLYGMMAGFAGPVAGTHVVGAVWIAGFIVIGIAGLIEAEKPDAV